MPVTLSLPGRGAACKGLAFGPGGKRLLLASLVPDRADGRSMGFSGKSPLALACVDAEARKNIGETAIRSSAAFALSPDGETVAVEDGDGVRVLHLPTGKERCAIPAKVLALAFAPDGGSLLVVGEDGRAALHDAAKGKKLRDLEGRLANKDIALVGFAGGTAVALDGGWDSAPWAVVWDARTGKRAAGPPGHDAAVTCLAYSPEGKTLVTGSLDRTVRLWDAGGKHLRLVAEHKDAIRAVAFSPDGKRAASIDASGEARLATVEGKLLGSFAGLPKARAISFSRDGGTVFVGGEGAAVLAFKAGDKGPEKVPTDGVAVPAFGAGAWAATVDGSGFEGPARVGVWDLKANRLAVACKLEDARGGGVRCEAVAFCPEGRLLATSQVSEYQGIRPSYGAAKLILWERVSGEPIRELGEVVSPLLAFSPGGRFLAATGAGRSGHLRVGYGTGLDVWDTLTGEKARTLPMTPECAAFSPDGTRLATGGRDGCVTLWEVPRPAPPKEAKPTPEAWWAALAKDARAAHAAIAQMAGAPAEAAALLKERLPPVSKPDTAAAARLIARLGSDDFDERQAAGRGLEEMGEGVAALLAKAAEGDLEVRRRAERLLGKWSDA
ncbi:MAG: hypothetical protein K2W96_04110, partial [Gemmataceae bacterium]|nr:hypothetical protein [Gemmataceae bacterium]